MLIRETLLLRLLGIAKIPILFALRPRVLRLDEDSSEVLIPLRWFSRNHVGSMYFAALAAGSDCSGGLCAARSIFFEGHRGVVPIFKSLRVEFLKLADGDVLFRCDDGRAISAAVERADRSGERVTLPIHVVATVPSRHGEAPVARFELELSLKKKERR